MTEHDNAASEAYYYWESRKNLIYYQYIDFLVRAFAHDCESLIDIGAKKTSIIENYDWIPERYTLDKEVTPYTSENVKGIQMDFFDFEPAEKFDFATCLQVLEHIPDVEAFTKKIFALANRVLISVPYMWEPGAEDHVHDPVDLEKLYAWTGREPTYYVIVTEPLIRPGRDKRVICYYHLEDETINLRQVRKRVEKIYEASPINEPGSKENDLDSLSERLKNQQLTVKHLKDQLAEEKQKNSELENKIYILNNKLEKANHKIQKLNNRLQRLESSYESVIQSTSWKYTAPLRKIVGVIKNTGRKIK